MSEVLPFDVNAAIKADATITSLAGGTAINIIPLNNAEPCDSSGSPLGKVFLRYYWMPGQFSINRWFMRRDKIRYYVMDRDYVRMMKVADRLIYMLNNVTEPENGHIVTCEDNLLHVKHSWITNSTTLMPNEKNGLAQVMLEFEFRYVPLESNLHWDPSYEPPDE